MKATIPLFRTTRLAFFSVTASALIFLGWNVKDKFVPAISISTPTIGTAVETAPQMLPFAFQEVVRYFEDALAMAPQRLTDQVIFHGGSYHENFYTITVTRRGADVRVDFNVIDDYGMSMVREFFEAPFFQRGESEQFYPLLNGRNVTRTLHMPRFNVFFEYNSPDFAANIIMNFSPRFRSLSAPVEATTP